MTVKSYPPNVRGAQRTNKDRTPRAHGMGGVRKIFGTEKEVLHMKKGVLKYRLSACFLYASEIRGRLKRVLQAI